MTEKRHILTDILCVLLFSVLCAAATARFTAGDFGVGFRGALLLSVPVMVLLAVVYRRFGGGKLLFVLMFLTFALRLGGGLAVQNLLPLYGHPDERREELGFLFDDAYRRDEEAWTAAVKEDLSFMDTLTREYHNDQYGAMAVMGVWIYKYLSPDARRFSFLFILGVFFTTFGLPFLKSALDDRFGSRAGMIAALIYTLYPDAIFYSSAAMREPFLIGIVAVGFWALCTMEKHLKKSLMVWLICIAVCFPFSSLVAAVLAAAGVLWFWAERLISRSRVWLWLGIICAVVGILGALLTSLPAFREWIHYDIHTTEVGSGWVEKVVGEVGTQFRSIFVAVYGITQPILPAILVYPVTPACVLNIDKCTTIFWKIAGIFRAAGWYLLVPFLFYAIFTTFREKDRKEKAVLIINALFIPVWIFIASLRAGGDQWDNPRYRVIFLPWMAFLAAWGIDRAVRMKDWWLVRWIAIELVFLAHFTRWYASRYSGNAIHRYPFWETVIRVTIECGLIFATGLIDPIRRKLKKSEE